MRAYAAGYAAAAGLLAWAVADPGPAAATVPAGLLLLAVCLPWSAAERRRRRLRGRGRTAVATVLAVDDVGRGEVRARLLVAEWDDEEPYEAERVLPAREAPRRGDRFAVVVDPRDPARVEPGGRYRVAPVVAAALEVSARRARPAEPLPWPAGDLAGAARRLNAERRAGRISDMEFADAVGALLAERGMG